MAEASHENLRKSHIVLQGDGDHRAEKADEQVVRVLRQGDRLNIYPTRPSECRTFNCLWLSDENFPDEFKPLRSKIVFTVEYGGRRVSAHVDAAFPGAWQEKKLYALLKRMSAVQAQKNSQLLVFIGKRAIAVLPDRDVDLGDVNLEGNAIFYEKNRTTGRIEVTVGAVPTAC